MDFYRDERGRAPVDEFMQGLEPAMRRKVTRNLAELERLGFQLGMPLARPIRGHSFWELRVQAAGNIVRIFYFLVTGRRIILLHGFLKKDQRTPQAELAIAAKRRSDFLRRSQT